MTRLRVPLCLIALLCLSGAAAAATLDDIRERGTIRIGVRQDARPFSYYNDLGEPAGYTVELCRAVSARLKAAMGLPELKVEYVKVTAEDRFDAVKEGRIDLLCGAATITLSRREQVSFSTPIYITGAAILYRSDGPQSFAELDGRKIGVRSGTTTEESLVKTVDRFGIKTEIMRFADHKLALEALKDNTIAAYFGDRAILAELIKDSPSDEIKLSEALLTVELYGLALRRGDEDFRLAVDRALAQLFQSAELTKIYRGTFGSKSPGALLEAVYLQGALPE
jgi:polar amino acid transport system substrate-binding protein/glutamate/aspartate transport system substrate-binding protein